MLVLAGVAGRRSSWKRQLPAALMLLALAAPVAAAEIVPGEVVVKTEGGTPEVRKVDDVAAAAVGVGAPVHGPRVIGAGHALHRSDLAR